MSLDSSSLSKDTSKMGSGKSPYAKLPKKERLTHTQVFESLFTSGQTLKSYPIQLRYLKREDSGNADMVQVAFTAPKRRLKKAVHRNLVKRRMRAAYQANKHLVFNNMKGNFAFLFLYLGNTTPSYATLHKSMQDLLCAVKQKENQTHDA
ncbi:MAG: ribonuclease P protein component [Bacteroidota bacterium]